MTGYSRTPEVYHFVWEQSIRNQSNFGKGSTCRNPGPTSGANEENFATSNISVIFEVCSAMSYLKFNCCEFLQAELLYDTFSLYNLSLALCAMFIPVSINYFHNIPF